MKWLLRLIMGLLVLVAVIFVFRNQVVKAAVTFGAKQLTGLNLTITKLDLDTSKTFVEVGGLRLENPAGFEDRTMVDLPLVFIDYKLADILKGNIHLEALKLHLKEVTVIRNKDGKLNLDALKGTQPPAAAPKTGSEPAGTAKQPAPPAKIQIDSLDLKIEKVIFKDYSIAAQPIVQTFDVNIDEHHENITNPEVLVRLIITKALRNTTIARLTNINMDFLQQNVFDVGTVANKTVTDLGNKAVGTVEETLGKTTGMMGEKSKELVGSLGSSLKTNVKLPFGKKEEAPQ